MRTIVIILTFIVLDTACKNKQLCHKVLSSPSETFETKSPDFFKNESENIFKVVDKKWINNNEGLIPDLVEDWLRKNTNVTILSKTVTITNNEDFTADFSVEYTIQQRSKGDNLEKRTSPLISIEGKSSHEFKLELPVKSQEDVVDIGTKVLVKKIQVKKIISGAVLLYEKECYSCECDPSKDKIKGIEKKYTNQQQLDSIIYKYETE